MSYTLRLTNGKILLTLADQQLDSVSTSLTLIGKNVNAYGDDVNSNFIHLLENFASDTEPTSPLVGQLWFDKFSQRVNVYTDSLQFKPVGGPILSNTAPEGLVAGDLWIDTQKNQLSFYDGAALTLVGPQYDSSLGKSGVLVEEVLDTSSIPNLISKIYANGAVLGTISSSTFTPRVDYLDAVGGINPIMAGFTASPGVKFYGTATSAESLGNIASEDIIIRSTPSPQLVVSHFGIYNDDGLSVGSNEDLSIYVGAGQSVNLETSGAQDFNIIGKTTVNSNVPLIHYSADTGGMSIFTATNATDVDLLIYGDTRIQGNLYVDGTSTFIESEVLRVEDKYIVLAYGSNDDAFANGGGLYLSGATEKRLTWQASTQAWRSSEHIDLPAGKVYKLNGQPVLTETSLGVGVTSAPGLTSVGGLVNLRAGLVTINTSTIGVVNAVPLIIGTGATTEINFNGRKLRNAYTSLPGDGEPDSTVATIGYVQNTINTNISGQFALQIDVTGYAASSSDVAMDNFIIDMLNNYLLPPSDPDYGVRPGGRARVLATRLSTTTTVAVSNAIGFASVSVYEAGTTNPVDVIVNDRPYVANTTVPGSQIKVDRVIKQYRVNSSFQWEAYPAGAGANTIHVYGTW